MPLRGLTALVITLSVALRVASQNSNITCGAQYAWMTNSRAQNPCVVSAYLESACLSDPQQAFVYPLNPGFSYRAPSQESETICTCSTVYYATLMACTACQGSAESVEFSTPWSTWTTNCSGVALERWPTKVPVGTAIPSWAFLDIAQPDRFNITTAEIIAAERLPDTAVVPVMQPTSSSSAPQSTQTEIVNDGASKVNAGAIAGAAVGALFLGGAVVAVAIYCHRARRRRRARSSQASSAGVTVDSEKMVVETQQGALLDWTPYDPTDPTAYLGTTIHSPMPIRETRFTGLPEI